MTRVVVYLPNGRRHCVGIRVVGWSCGYVYMFFSPVVSFFLLRSCVRDLGCLSLWDICLSWLAVGV